MGLKESEAEVMAVFKSLRQGTATQEAAAMLTLAAVMHAKNMNPHVTVQAGPETISNGMHGGSKF